MRTTNLASSVLERPPAPHVEQLEAAGLMVQHTVAAGPFGLVYRARDIANHRDVAVKVIDLEALHPTQGPHSQLEVDALAALRHPHIVPLFSSGAFDGALRYFVMPWIDGPSLRTRIRASRRLSIVDALRIGVGIADALVALHARGLIHRDVKPENVLFDGRHPVLIDFGLVCTSHAESISEDDADPIVGTPAYMAPEQWRHGAAMDGRADIFGVGAMLYETLTGVSPSHELRRDRLRRTAWRWSESQPEEETLPPDVPAAPVVNLRTRRSDAPEQLEALLRRALRLDPSARISSAAEFRDELEHLLASQLSTRAAPRWFRSRP